MAHVESMKRRAPAFTFGGGRPVERTNSETPGPSDYSHSDHDTFGKQGRAYTLKGRDGFADQRHPAECEMKLSPETLALVAASNELDNFLCGSV